MLLSLGGGQIYFIVLDGMFIELNAGGDLRSLTGFLVHCLKKSVYVLVLHAGKCPRLCVCLVKTKGSPR